MGKREESELGEQCGKGTKGGGQSIQDHWETKLSE